MSTMFAARSTGQTCGFALRLVGSWFFRWPTWPLPRWHWHGIATGELSTAILQTADRPKLEVLAELETNFLVKEIPNIQVTFWKDASGKVFRLMSLLDGVGDEAKRLNESDPGAK
jgi:hypothetical protein